jgi:hypothetical protein
MGHSGNQASTRTSRPWNKSVYQEGVVGRNFPEIVIAPIGRHANLTDMAPIPSIPETNASERKAFLDPEGALSPFKVDEWRRLTPAERLQRAWALRRRLKNPRDVHDRKLFPAP